MFLGSRVDDALSAYHRRILEHGDRFSVDQVLDVYREPWQAELDAEREAQDVDGEVELTERQAFALGRQAIELAMAELVPHLGDPVDVQRRLEFTFAPELEWTVLCYLDLETFRERRDGEPERTVVDLKLKSTPIGQDRADSDPQAGLYLAGRWLEAYPARELVFAQIAKPGRRHKQVAFSLVATGRTAGQLRARMAKELVRTERGRHVASRSVVLHHLDLWDWERGEQRQAVPGRLERLVPPQPCAQLGKPGRQVPGAWHGHRSSQGNSAALARVSVSQ